MLRDGATSEGVEGVSHQPHGRNDEAYARWDCVTVDVVQTRQNGSSPFMGHGSRVAQGLPGFGQF